jgi:uncharacterized protein (TIGR02246 family)
MRNYRMCWMTVVMLLVPHAIQAQTERSWSEEQGPIADLIQRTADANNAGDAEAWVALFTDDFVYMAPGAPEATTKAGLREVAEAGFRHQADIHIIPLEIAVTGSWAYARSRVGGTVVVQPSGEVVNVDVKQIVIYRRDAAGAWRIARLISNSNS